MISLFVGLGNIGSRYQGTRHNLGFEVVELAVKKIGAKPLAEDFFYQPYEKTIEDRRIVFAKPTTMMNGSGGAVVAILDNLGLPPSKMLVVVDDFNIPLGTIRFRPNGSDGGHNGLESIIGSIQTENFPRLRLGIGPVPLISDPTAPPLGGRGQTRASAVHNLSRDEDTSSGRPIDIVDFVLGKFSESEHKIAKKMIDIAAEAVIFATGHRFEETMSKYNYNPV